jgi:hypothetical protein
MSIKARAMTTPTEGDGAVHEHLPACTYEGGNEPGDVADLGVHVVLVLHREAHEDLAEWDRRDPRSVPVLEIGGPSPRMPGEGLRLASEPRRPAACRDRS